LGLVPRPEGSLAEQFLEAERTNLSMGAGAALLHSAFPRMGALERSLDLNLQSLQAGGRWQNTEGISSFAMASAGERIFSSDSESSLDSLTGPHYSQMRASGLGQPGRVENSVPPEILTRLSTLLDGESTKDPEALKQVARHFSTLPETLHSWIVGFRGVLEGLGRSQPQEQSVQALYEILSFYQDRPQILNRLFRYFSYTANEYQEPHRRLQNFFEALNLGLGSVQLYERLGVKMNAAQPQPLAREALEDGYFLQISPGEGEAAGSASYPSAGRGPCSIRRRNSLAERSLGGLDRAQWFSCRGKGIIPPT
jgi:hypothetical protein